MSTEVFNPDEMIARYRERARCYVIWKASFLGGIILGSLAVVFGVTSLVLFAIDSSVYEVLKPASFVFNFMAVISCIGPFVSYKARKKESAIVVDPDLNTQNLKFLVPHLKSMGIEDPVRYLATHREHVAAFNRLSQVSSYEIDPPPSYKGTRSDFNNKKFIEALMTEKNKVSALVFPGEKELAREHQITQLIKERGIKQYSEIKAIVEETKDEPLPLIDGVL